MAKQAYVYSGTDWVPLASEVTNLSGYQTKALNQFPNRNLIINGDMQIAQRATSAAGITVNEYNTADRWATSLSSLGTWTQSVENDAPTGSGFRKSLKMLCTTADASPAAGDLMMITQKLEGQNLQHIKKGTSAAEQLTLSFWVKANVTGTYILDLYDNDNARQVSKSYTINASGTWEYKTLTFPADTTGAFDNDNALSLYCFFWLGAGTTYTSGTLNTSWASATSANRAVGQTNLASATNNYWQVTGVQLEVGDTATPFEFKPFAQDLEECLRYYWRSESGSNQQKFAQGPAYASQYGITNAINLLTPMRIIPHTLDYGGSIWLQRDAGAGGGGVVSISIASSYSNTKQVSLNYEVSGGLTQGTYYELKANSSSSAYIGLSAEL
jgi:hypothetical protein